MNIQPTHQLPGDSIRDLFIPKRWRSRLQPLSSGHVNSLTIPKRSRFLQNCQVDKTKPIILKPLVMFSSTSPKQGTMNLPHLRLVNLRSVGPGSSYKWSFTWVAPINGRKEMGFTGVKSPYL